MDQSQYTKSEYSDESDDSSIDSIKVYKNKLSSILKRIECLDNKGNNENLNKKNDQSKNSSKNSESAKEESNTNSCISKNIFFEESENSKDQILLEKLSQISSICPPKSINIFNCASIEQESIITGQEKATNLELIQAPYKIDNSQKENIIPLNLYQSETKLDDTAHKYSCADQGKIDSEENYFISNQNNDFSELVSFYEKIKKLLKKNLLGLHKIYKALLLNFQSENLNRQINETQQLTRILFMFFKVTRPITIISKLSLTKIISKLRGGFYDELLDLVSKDISYFVNNNSFSLKPRYKKKFLFCEFLTLLICVCYLEMIKYSIIDNLEQVETCDYFYRFLFGCKEFAIISGINIAPVMPQNKIINQIEKKELIHPKKENIEKSKIKKVESKINLENLPSSNKKIEISFMLSSRIKNNRFSMSENQIKRLVLYSFNTTLSNMGLDLEKSSKLMDILEADIKRLIVYIKARIVNRLKSGFNFSTLGKNFSKKLNYFMENNHNSKSVKISAKKDKKSECNNTKTVFEQLCEEVIAEKPFKRGYEKVIWKAKEKLEIGSFSYFKLIIDHCSFLFFENRRESELFITQIYQNSFLFR